MALESELNKGDLATIRSLNHSSKFFTDNYANKPGYGRGNDFTEEALETIYNMTIGSVVEVVGPAYAGLDEFPKHMVTVKLPNNLGLRNISEKDLEPLFTN